MSEEYSPDFDFRHHLRDTILLLGGKKEIADLLMKSQDGLLSESDIDELRNYNCTLINGVKARLSELNRLKVRVIREGDQ